MIPNHPDLKYPSTGKVVALNATFEQALAATWNNGFLYFASGMGEQNSQLHMIAVDNQTNVLRHARLSTAYTHRGNLLRILHPYYVSLYTIFTGNLVACLQ